MRIYIDTNIYLDYLLERRNRRGKNLADFAYSVFARAIACEFEVVLSDHVTDELYRLCRPEETRVLFAALTPKIIKVKLRDMDRKKAAGLPNHFSDALHAILAKRSDSTLIVTRNVADFRGIFQAKRPEDV